MIDNSVYLFKGIYLMTYRTPGTGPDVKMYIRGPVPLIISVLAIYHLSKKMLYKPEAKYAAAYDEMSLVQKCKYQSKCLVQSETTHSVMMTVFAGTVIVLPSVVICEIIERVIKYMK